MTDGAKFQRYYASVLFREYCIRKQGPLGKRSWRNLMEWAWKARKRARELSVPVQRDLFGDAA